MAEVTVPYATPIVKVKFTPVVTNIWKGDADFFHYQMLADITFNLNIEMDVNDSAGTDNYYQFGYNWFSESGDDDSYGELSASRPPSLSIGTFEYNAELLFILWRLIDLQSFQEILSNLWYILPMIVQFYCAPCRRNQ